MPRKPKLHDLPFFGPVQPGSEPTFANCPGTESWAKKLEADDPETRAFFSKLQKHMLSVHHTFDTAWMKKQYEETKNPFFAWHVYASCKKRNRKVPGWVEEYLYDIVARRVLEVEEYSNKAAGYMLGFSDAPNAQGKGQGKGGGRKPCQQFNRLWLLHNIPKEVTLRISKFPNKNLETIYEEIRRDWKLNIGNNIIKQYYNASSKDGPGWNDLA